MARSIFDTDPDARPEKREAYSDDSVGKFHMGRQVVNEKGSKVPEVLNEWRVSTADRGVADAIAQLLGGTPEEDEESESENFIDVLTSAASVPVILSNADAIYWDMKKWDNGKLTHHCDGSKWLFHPSRDEMIGQPCGCSPLYAQRKQDAADGIGPKPSITVRFRLADDPELGEFTMQTGSWQMLAALDDYYEDLGDIDGEALANMAITLVEFVPKKGKMKGKLVSYNKPELKRIRSYNAAIAE